MGNLTKICLIGACVCLALTAATPAQARKHRPNRCAMRASTTIAANSQVRVFRRETVSTVTVYACRYGRGKRFTLGRADTADGQGENTYLETVAGSVVAYAIQPFDDSQRYNPDFEGFSTTIHVLHLKTGLDTSAVAVPNVPSSSASALVLHPNGSAAWTAKAGSAIDLRRLSIDGKASLISSGADIDGTSLALGGSTLYWTQAGVARSTLIG
jgi:hypothetical protein